MINSRTAGPRWVFMVLSLFPGAGLLAIAPDSDATADGKAREIRYLQANSAAMAKMMRNMHIRPSGDVDRDFVRGMIPHHQGAIDMAVAILQSGRNEQLKRIAQEIIVTQQQEIAAMRLAIGESDTNVGVHP
jgi:uncharacterized protein (DUF305 family)